MEPAATAVAEFAWFIESIGLPLTAEKFIADAFEFFEKLSDERVNIKYIDPSPTSKKTYAFSGLFNGNIGDSILITKGRFDFEIDASRIIF